VQRPTSHASTSKSHVLVSRSFFRSLSVALSPSLSLSLALSRSLFPSVFLSLSLCVYRHPSRAIPSVEGSTPFVSRLPPAMLWVSYSFDQCAKVGREKYEASLASFILDLFGEVHQLFVPEYKRCMGSSRHFAKLARAYRASSAIRCECVILGVTSQLFV
jgi:hypothetical protein